MCQGHRATPPSPAGEEGQAQSSSLGKEAHKQASSAAFPPAPQTGSQSPLPTEPGKHKSRSGPAPRSFSQDCRAVKQ